MKPIELGFERSGAVLRWQAPGLAQVIQLDKKGVAHSYCEICVLGLVEPDPLVVGVLSWHQAAPLMLTSWDIASFTISHRSQPSDEIPVSAADVLLSMRTPTAIYEWIKLVGGKTPPARFWLTAIAAHWANERYAAIAAINQYLGCRVGPELLERAERMKTMIENSGNQ